MGVRKRTVNSKKVIYLEQLILDVNFLKGDTTTSIYELSTIKSYLDERNPLIDC